MKTGRKFTRFKPDPLTIAFIDFGEQKSFIPMEVGLVANESFTGCALVFQRTEKLEKGMAVKIKVGKLKPLPAHVIWSKKIDEGFYKVGFQFLE